VRLHVMQRTVFRKPFCPFVCPSVCRTRVSWQNERNLCRHFYTIWKNVYPSFLTRILVGGGRAFVPEILGQTDPV